MSDGTIDLLNVDYEDVLHLYRGWRHAESQLKEKNKELNSLKNRIKQLQDSHTKFRGQIQALESVKELTVTLKAQLAALEEENKQLVIENSTLTEVNNQAEELLIEGESTTHKLSSQLNKTSIETAEYKGRCQQLLESQAELEKLLNEEQSARLAAENRLKSLEQTIEKLNNENREYKWKLENSYTRIDQYNREIESASSHLAQLSGEISDMNTLKERVSFLETEKNILKRDIIRLLRLLEHYPAGKGFLKQWQDSEGMSFVGTAYHSSSGDINKHQHTGEYKLTYYDDVNNNNQNYNDMDYTPVTPQELAQFKRVHQVEQDTNPMFPTMEEELDHWTPHSSIVQGYQYLNSKLPVAPIEVLQTFLRRMNKIWLRREKRKIERVKENYEGKITDLKRQLSNARPYHGVMAERKIRCLNNQVKSIRCKSLKCKPKQWNEYDSDDDDMNLYSYDGNTTRDYDNTLSSSLTRGRKLNDFTAAEMGWVSPLSKPKRSNSQPPPLTCQKCQARERLSSRSPEDYKRPSTPTNSGNSNNIIPKKSQIEKLAAKELLGASLHSLEVLHRQQNASSIIPQSSTVRSLDGNNYESLYTPHSIIQDSYGTPSAEYLRGAIWLGRNIHMITEDLVEQLDQYRTKYLREISILSRNPDNGQNSSGNSISHRLSLFAATSITDIMTIAYNSRTKSRKMLQRASSITPGNQEALSKFLLELPIESILNKGYNDFNESFE